LSEQGIIIETIDGVDFRIRENRDFSFLNELGKVFTVFDQNDSGNLSFGVKNTNDEKFFVKIAGMKTAESFRSPIEAVNALEEAMEVYEAIRFPHLIELVKHFKLDDLYVAVFKWVSGECLFDHWNFEKYAQNSTIQSPMQRFKSLPITKKVRIINTLFDFLMEVEKCGYVAVDFYEGSILYDFDNDILTICDIDFFRKNPVINTMGKDYWGSKRIKAPEEYVLGAKIDSITNVYALGALIFHLCGEYSKAEISEIYEKSEFFPYTYEKWGLEKSLYDICMISVQKERAQRYRNLYEFAEKWKLGVRNLINH